MPVILNHGGTLNLPDVTLTKGATLVDPGAWARAAKHPAVKAHLSSGRLEIQRGAAKTPTAKQAEPPPTPVPLPDPEPEPKVDIVTAVAAMSAKEACSAAATLEADALEALLEVETRKTVLAALEERRAWLAGDDD
jgi:hypothetical protein